MIPLVDLKSQYRSIKDEIDSAIAEVVESCHFILGPQVEAFEADLATYCEMRFAFGVNSGTSALHLALLAAGVGPGDEVITVSYTFVATAAAIDFPHTERAAAETLSLPMYPELTREDLLKVADSVRKFSPQRLAVHP